MYAVFKIEPLDAEFQCKLQDDHMNFKNGSQVRGFSTNEKWEKVEKTKVPYQQRKGFSCNKAVMPDMCAGSQCIMENRIINSIKTKMVSKHKHQMSQNIK